MKKDKKEIKVLTYLEFKSLDYPDRQTYKSKLYEAGLIPASSYRFVADKWEKEILELYNKPINAQMAKTMFIGWTDRLPNLIQTIFNLERIYHGVNDPHKMKLDEYVVLCRLCSINLSWKV